MAIIGHRQKQGLRYWVAASVIALLTGAMGLLVRRIRWRRGPGAPEFLGVQAEWRDQLEVQHAVLAAP